MVWSSKCCTIIIEDTVSLELAKDTIQILVFYYSPLLFRYCLLGTQRCEGNDYEVFGNNKNNINNNNNNNNSPASAISARAPSGRHGNSGPRAPFRVVTMDVEADREPVWEESEETNARVRSGYDIWRCIPIQLNVFRFRLTIVQEKWWVGVAK